MAVGHIIGQDKKRMMNKQQGSFFQSAEVTEEWRKWKSQKFEIAGRIEVNYDLSSLFNVDVTKVLAVQIYFQVTDLASGQERIIRHVIPVLIHSVIYDVRTLQFEAGTKNEFEIIAKHPDGKPAKIEDLIVTVSMNPVNEKGKLRKEKSTEIKNFYTRSV